jgi:S1-C subfamily serine protease
MNAGAQFKVSSREGQIGQTKRMISGWDAFEMTAVTRSGDSGGPVLNEQGQVIGLNVGAAQDKPDAISLAVLHLNSGGMDSRGPIVAVGELGGRRRNSIWPQEARAPRGEDGEGKEG